MSYRTRSSPRPPKPYSIAIAAILVFAVIVRFFGQGWDDGRYFHPDERFIATVMDGRLSMPGILELDRLFDPDHSPLNTRSVDENGNPREFAYGSLPFLVTTVLGTIAGAPFEAQLTSYDNVWRFGRILTALVDIGTVILVILFARRAFGELASAIAGLLTAASVVLIQLAHFFTVDTWVTFFTIATLYACLFVLRDFDLRWSLAAAAFGGAALATKASVGVLGIPIIVATVLGARASTPDWLQVARMVVRRLAISAIPTVLVFAVFEPYAIWRPGAYIGDIRAQWEIVNGHFDVPFTRQFVGTTAGITEIQDLVLWGIAPGFGLAALVAVGIGLFWCIRIRDPRYLLLLSWIVPYFYIIASSEARFLRYAAPLVPPLAIIVGHQLSYWWHQTGGFRVRRALSSATIGIVTAITVIWAILFMGVYVGPHPRVAASEWIYENVEPGSTLTEEAWDDRLPVRLSATQASGYEHLRLDLYGDQPNEEAFEYIADFLEEADYIILASQRLSHSIPRLPWRYPVESAYYRLLHDEQLGFELAYHATNYPGFGPLRIDTLGADESFSVYDHTPVWIFRKVESLSRDELELRFAHALNQPWIPERDPPEPTLLLDVPVGERQAAADAGWSAPLTGSGPAAVLVWLLTLAILGLIAFPLSLHLFPRFSDSGIGFSYLLGLIGVGALVWLGWSLDLLPFTVWTVLVAAGLLAGVLWLVIGLPGEWERRLRDRWTVILTGQGVFLFGFGLVLLLRALNPDLWHPAFGGERPMETAYLNAIAGSLEFPPHDPWFADGYINYYYYGFFLSALLWKVTGIPSEIAFQLTLATIAGLLSIGLFSLGSTVTGSVLQSRRRQWLIPGGLLTVTLGLLAGNLDAIRQVISGRSLDVDFWQSSRVVDFAINEFPYFSFLYGDLHPHLIAAPVLVLVVALAHTWVQSASRESTTWAFLWAGCVAVTGGTIIVINFWDGPTAGIIIAAGMVFALFRKSRESPRRLAWYLLLFPAIAGLAWLYFYQFHIRFFTPTGSFERTTQGTTVGDWSIHFGGIIAILTVFAAVAFWRYWPRSPVGEVNLLYGASLALGAYLVTAVFGSTVHGDIFTFVLVGLLVAGAGAFAAQVAVTILERHGETMALLMMSPFVVFGGALALVRPVASISSFLVAGFIALLSAGRHRDGTILIAICGSCAAGLVLTADLIFIADHLRHSDWERMNTVFKLYFQSWTLFAIPAAAALIWLFYQWLSPIDDPDDPDDPEIENGGSRGLYLSASIAGAVVLASMLAYPLLATSDRLDHRMDSTPGGLALSGNAWMDGGTLQNQEGDVIDFSGDYDAITWLRNNVDNNAVILEAAIGPYRGGGSRISSATGLPAVLGWDSHQSQQRGSQMVSPRASDVREMYRTGDIERKRYLLRRYLVEYVVVGDVERYTLMGDPAEGEDPEYYSSDEGLLAFVEMVGEDLEVAFESRGTVIYRVLPFPTAGQEP